MITFGDTVSVGVLMFGFKVWHDIVLYIRHRERMQAYRFLVQEGMALVRLAAETGMTSESGRRVRSVSPTQRQ
tara:strand:- start:898 stop:1116 length:219 start_codon:yes stop_codon:yes gene_type:complete